MIYFYDLSCKLIYATPPTRSIITFAGWSCINQSAIQFIILSGTLYALAGSGYSFIFIKEESLNSWIGWIGLCLWGSLLVAAILCFLTHIPWAIILILASTVLYIIWTVSIYVNLDTRLHEAQS